MTAELEALRESASAMLADALSSQASTDAGTRAWSQLERSGMTLVGVPEDAGGSGGTLAYAAAVLAAAAEQGAPVPLAETAWLAGWVLASGGRPVPAGRLTAAAAADGSVSAQRDGDGFVLSGRAGRVPYLRESDRLLLLFPYAGRFLAADLAARSAAVEPGENLAGEPRDDAILDAVRVPSGEVFDVPDGVNAGSFTERIAAARLVQLGGAARRALALTADHVSTRIQFGRPLMRFQAVQHRIAAIAAEVRVLETAADMAVSELDRPEPGPPVQLAASVVAAYDAAGIVSANAHQLLGAMGFTREHPLHIATTRLWSWRQELGPVHGWLTAVAASTLHSGRPDLWAQLTTKEWID